MSFITVSLGMTFLSLAVTLHNQVTHEIALKQALYDCMAGAARGFSDLTTGRIERGAMQELYKDNFSGYKILGPTNDEGIWANYDKIVAYGRSNYLDSDINKEAIVGITPGEYWSDFAFIFNKMRDPVRGDIIYPFFGCDTVKGMVHFNDTLLMSFWGDNPIFTKRVSTSDISFHNFGNRSRFLGDLRYRPRIIFPDQATELRQNAGYNWGTLGHDSLTQLILSDSLIYMRKCGRVLVNGVYKIHCTPSTISESQVFAIPESKVIFINGKTWISASRGRIDFADGEYPQDSNTDGGFISNGFSGELTIGSADTMIIADNIIYKHSRSDFSIPFPSDSCNEVLGLISENYIMISRMVSDTTYVHAALAAVRGSITVEDIYWYQAPGWDNEKQSLNIWGSLAQRNQGIMHTHEPNYHLRGFIEKNYHYDERLPSNPPPHFPFVRDERINFIDERVSL